MGLGVRLLYLQAAQVDCLLTFDQAHFTPQVAAQTGLKIQTLGELVTELRAVDLGSGQ